MQVYHSGVVIVPQTAVEKLKELGFSFDSVNKRHKTALLGVPDGAKAVLVDEQTIAVIQNDRPICTIKGPSGPINDPQQVLGLD